MGGGKNSASILISQMQAYMEFQCPWNTTYVEEFHNNPKTWWNCAITNDNFIQSLALKILALTPHNLSCERIFSVLGWFCNKRRMRYVNLIIKIKIIYINFNFLFID